jgi:hypothetical protein
MASEQHNHRIQPLNGNNYTTWSEEMKALLRSKGLWRLVDGKEMRPSTPAKEQEAWDIKQDRAAGELMLNLMPDQRVHIRDSQDDPTAAWKALAALFVQQKASTRFVAYEEFFSIRKRSDESLPALSARVEQAMARIQELRPISFDLKTSDAELSCMAMMHALGPEYSHFTSSLALLTDLDKDKVKAAFQTEEINRRPRSDPHPPSGSSALSTSTSSCSCNHSAPCAFCDKTGHCQCKCYSLQRAKDTYKSSKRTGRRTQPGQHHLCWSSSRLCISHSCKCHSGRWNVLATQVFVPGIPLIRYPLSNSMLTSIGCRHGGHFSYDAASSLAAH